MFMKCVGCEIVECGTGDAYLKRDHDGFGFVHLGEEISNLLALHPMRGQREDAPYVLDPQGRLFVGADWLIGQAEAFGKVESAKRIRRLVARCEAFLGTEAENN